MDGRWRRHRGCRGLQSPPPPPRGRCRRPERQRPQPEHALAVARVAGAVLADGEQRARQVEGRVLEVDGPKGGEGGARAEVAPRARVVRPREARRQQVARARAVDVAQHLQASRRVEVEEDVAHNHEVDRPQRLRRQVEAAEAHAATPGGGVVAAVCELQRLDERRDNVSAVVGDVEAAEGVAVDDARHEMEIAARQVGDRADAEQLDQHREDRADARGRRQPAATAAHRVVAAPLGAHLLRQPLHAALGAVKFVAHAVRLAEYRLGERVVRRRCRR